MKKVAIITFPGIGNVGMIVSQYLLNNFKTKLINKIYSNELPAMLINSDGNFKLPAINEYKIDNREIFLYVGDAQPSTEKGVYNLSKILTYRIKKQKIKEVIAIGGIGLDEEIMNPKLFMISNDNKIKNKLSSFGIRVANKNINVVFGMIGTIFGILSEEKIRSSIILSETSNQFGYIEFNGARKIIEFLSKYLNFKINFKIEQAKIKDKKQETQINYQSHYIG